KTVLRSRHTHMPKFLRIGVHQSNVSGYTSKAWWVRRVGSTVFLKWGAVEVHGVGDKRKIYWTIPQEKTIRCGTLQRAKDYVKNAIARRRSHRYEPLSGDIAIRRRPANRGAELEQALATILFAYPRAGYKQTRGQPRQRLQRSPVSEMRCVERACPLPGSVRNPITALLSRTQLPEGLWSRLLDK